MKVLVVGSDGQVGRSFVERAPSSINIVALNRQQLDITNSAAVESMIQACNPDFVLNTAAYTQVDRAEQEPGLCFLVNSEGPKNLAQSCRRKGATLLHLSTDYVFSGQYQSPYSESDTPNPLNVYGQSKLAGELAIRDLAPKHIIIRTSWVFSEHGNNFVKTMLKLGRSKQELRVVSDQFGGPTHAGDLAEALCNIIEQLNSGSTKFGTYHFSGFPFVSWYEFANHIFDCVEDAGLFKTPAVNATSTSTYPTLATRPANSRLNCDQINRHFNISPSNWKKALKHIDRYMELK